MTSRFDAIVIGAGQAGPPLAARLSEAGMKVAVVERDRFGGTCVNTGCIPTKSLIASAYVAHTVRRAGEYGVGIAGEIAVDMKAVKARKDEISGLSRQHVERWLTGLKNTAVFRGAALRGRQDDSRERRRVCADKIFINVGGRAYIPRFPESSEPRPHKLRNDGGRFYSAASGRRWRQLRRSGVCADVSQIRCRGHCG